MNPSQRLFIAAIVLVAAAGGYAIGRTIFRPVVRVEQPVAFNHQKHAGELEMECNVCHEFYETAAHSGLPSLATCLGCHDDKDSENPEIRRLHQVAAAGGGDGFRKLFRIPDHTFYSHRRHVAIAKIPCETCHGEIAATTAPPQRPLVRITMALCLDCHRQHDVPSDCTTCHR